MPIKGAQAKGKNLVCLWHLSCEDQVGRFSCSYFFPFRVSTKIILSPMHIHDLTDPCTLSFLSGFSFLSVFFNNLKIESLSNHSYIDNNCK